MFFVKPEKIVFESSNDVVDYVTKGLPPSKKNFQRVMDKVRHPDATDDTLKPKMAKEVVITEGTISKEEIDILDGALERVYRNRIRNRNTILTGIGLVLGGVVCALLFKGSHKDSDSDYDFEYYVDDDGRQHVKPF